MTINVGIIGCGDIAMNKHLPNLYKHPDVVVRGFYNRTRHKAVTAQAHFGGEQSLVYDTPEALLNDKTIDAVYVLTANDTHATFAIDALNAGKHVMVEKPMARTLEEASQMVNAANENGAVLSVAYQNRHRGDVAALKQLIDQGTLGEIYAAKASSIRRRGIPTWGAFTNAEIQGGGPLIDIGSHALDLVLYFMGHPPIAHITGTTHAAIGPEGVSANRWGPWDPRAFGVEDSAFAFIKTNVGQSVFLEASYALNEVNEGENVITLYGSKAGARLSDKGVFVNWVNERFEEQRIDSEDRDAGYEEVATFIEALKTNTAPPVKKEEAYMVNEIIEAVYQQNSNKNGAM